MSLPAHAATPHFTLTHELSCTAEVVIVGVDKLDNGVQPRFSSLIDDSTTQALTRALKLTQATGKRGETQLLSLTLNSVERAVLAVGLGAEKDRTHEDVRRAFGSAGRALAGFASAAVLTTQDYLAPVVEGLGLGAYAWHGLKTSEPERIPVRSIEIVCEPDETSIDTIFDASCIIVDSVNTARDLVNTPCSHLYPESYAAELAALAQTYGLDTEILDENELRAQGYGGVLAVGKGSHHAPRFVRLAWNPEGLSDKAQHVALVGKGITFDTGGISLKPGAHMQDMISDMAGSATMAAVVIAAARLALPLRVTAYLPLAENMPGGGAYKPGDIITHYGGLTDEIHNTDAEGRVVMADALARASEDSPDYLIDVATLTGAQLVALGSRTSGVLGNDDTFRDLLAEIGRSVGENAWSMPIPEEMAEEYSSVSADIRNAGKSRNGGMLQAGYFLSRFVPSQVRWAHIDVAGPAYNTGSAYDYTPTRATGVPVRTLIAFLRSLV